MNFWQQLNTLLMVVVVLLAYTVPALTLAVIFVAVLAPMYALLIGVSIWAVMLVIWRYRAWRRWTSKETEDQEFDRLRSKYYAVDEPCFLTLDELRERETK